MHELLDGHEIHGVLPINKPVGISSKDVSRWLIKRVGRLKIGHAGTLDPAAGGVLPLLIGKATKLQDYLVDSYKSYEFEVEFGVETTTLDSEGVAVKTAPCCHITETLIEQTLKNFLGHIDQVPPMHSAIKWNGKPLYQYARSGKIRDQDMDLFRRKVFIRRLSLVGWVPPRATFRVTCSKGTYVRCLGRDIALAMTTVGSLTRLTRTYASGFDLAQCYSLEILEKDFLAENAPTPLKGLHWLSPFLIPLHKLKLSIPTIQLGYQLSQKLLFGQTVNVSESQREVSWEMRSTMAMGSSLLSKDFQFFEEGQNPEKSFPENPAVVVLSDDNRAIGIAHAQVLTDGQLTLKLRRGL